MTIAIDPQSAEPIFEQIVFQVKGAVARGELRPGDKLPSVRELARSASVNPNTVSRSYELLERDGVIVRRQGAGCFIKQAADNGLLQRERRRQLAERMQRVVTEGYHLGCTADDIRAALDRALADLDFDQGPASTERRTS